MVHNKRFDPKNADKLMSEKRKAELQPEKIIDYLDVNEYDTVADLGAGPGLFSLPLARLTDNDVYAVDIEPEMLERLKENAEAANIQNIKPIVSDLENINLADHSVARVLNTFVIHEVTDLSRAMDEIKRILKPGGYLLLVDWEAVETESGPPLEIRIPSKEMDNVLQENGFNTELFYLDANHYAIKAKKDGT
ncbi:class I SAM-dependent methyltransferase [Virgibacillus sp. NKC19-3]|uniref:class I SAM-dependent methyltransferase n=1 Tax=Virgibacillus saliphilus TaxID=2831674 RepID=UPI001C9B5DE6|nr:class I SAM-dependent methyltransferase [Virgibacillus sp. NKC19-3]MBY7142488.1 class I SAM-dependent methyltransferase [Virgibacillus sp. NKC19-3]